MARRFATDVDLLGFSLINAMLNPVSADPSGLGTGQAGRVWYNSTTNKLMYWNGTTAIDVRDRANHTGTQLASTISDLAATVKAYRLDEFAAPTADISVANHKLTNVTDPVGAQDAATRNYVDVAVAALTAGLTPKGAVAVAATTNVNIASPGATIDGITMANPMTILLTGQTTGSQNGPYVWTGSATPLTRATNWDTSAEAVLGSFWWVEQGSKANTQANLTNTSAITLGTTTPTFTFISNGTTYTQGNGISISTNVISAVANTGIIVNSSGIGADFTKVGRKFVGAIPTATGSGFTVVANVITINHGLSNPAPLFTVCAGTTPVSGYSAGQPVEMDYTCTDANNITLNLPGTTAPASANNWNVTVIG